MRSGDLRGLRTARHSSLLFSTGNDIFSLLLLDEPNRLLRMGIDGIDLSVEIRGETWKARVREKVDSDERVNRVRITDENGWKRM
jgi:hypothetical protein